MTVCECCEQLCDGLGPYCAECKAEFEEDATTDYGDWEIDSPEGAPSDE